MKRRGHDGNDDETTWIPRYMDPHPHIVVPPPVVHLNHLPGYASPVDLSQGRPADIPYPHLDRLQKDADQVIGAAYEVFDFASWLGLWFFMYIGSVAIAMGLNSGDLAAGLGPLLLGVTFVLSLIVAHFWGKANTN